MHTCMARLCYHIRIMLNIWLGRKNGRFSVLLYWKELLERTMPMSKSFKESKTMGIEIFI